MEEGLWGVFFALLIGMPATAIKQPKLYRRLAPIIWLIGLALGFAILIYAMLLSSYFDSLAGVIDPAKMTEAIAIRNGWNADWKVGAACFWFSIYAPVCVWISHQVEG